MKRTSELGLSLFEMLLALSILAILAAVAVPIASDWLERIRNEAMANTLLRHLQAARTLSIERGHTVVLCPVDESGCGDSWARGWQVRDTDEVLLRQADMPPGLKIRWIRTSAITYRHNGTSAGLNGTLSLCNTHGKEISRIAINNHGRARLARAKGRPLCLEQAAD
ncbi:type IV fimbrial biogenesis protein FimT [Pseudomonas oryzihabitans]